MVPSKFVSPVQVYLIRIELVSTVTVLNEVTIGVPPESLSIAASVVARDGLVAAVVLEIPTPFQDPLARPDRTQLVMLAKTASRVAAVACTIRSLSKRSNVAVDA